MHVTSDFIVLYCIANKIKTNWKADTLHSSLCCPISTKYHLNLTAVRVNKSKVLVQCLHCSRHFQVVTAQLARVCWATVICNKTITVNCNKMLCTLFYQAEANKKLCYHKKITRCPMSVEILLTAAQT